MKVLKRKKMKQEMKLYARNENDTYTIKMKRMLEMTPWL